MYVEALREMVEGLEVPGNCDSLRELLPIRDLLEAKICSAVEEVEHGGEWALEGSVSMVSWLRANGAMTAGAAKSLTVTAARLAALPVTTAAYESGALSTDQVRAIVAKVAERHVELFASHEAALVPTLIPMTVTEVAQTMEEWKQRADALDPLPEDADPKRELFFSKTFAATREMKGSFATEYGEVIDTALGLAKTKDAEDEHRSPAQRRADALIDICRFYLDNQAANPARRHRPHVNVIVDVKDVERGGPGRFASGEVAPAAFIEALGRDCNLHRVLARGRSAILDYGRSARSAPPDLFNALVMRDGGCREPGCDRPAAWCDAHHIAMWEAGGETSIDNMVLRCSRHHHLWHRRRNLGWTERMEADGTLVITAPDHRVYTSTPHGPLARQRQLAV